MTQIRNMTFVFITFALSFSLYAADKPGAYDKYLEHVKQILNSDPDIEVQKPFLFTAEDSTGHRTYILGTTWPADNALEYVPPSILDIVKQSDILLHDDSGNFAAITQAVMENQLNTSAHLTPSQLESHLSPPTRKIWQQIVQQLQKDDPILTLMLEMDVPQPINAYIGLALGAPIIKAAAKNPSYLEAKLAKQIKHLTEVLENTPAQAIADASEEALERTLAFQNGDKSAFNGMFSHRTSHQIIVDHAVKSGLRVQEFDSKVERANYFALANSIETFEDILIHSAQQNEEYDLTWGDMAGHDFDIMNEMQEYVTRQAPYMMSELTEHSATRWLNTFLALNNQKKRIVIAVDKRILTTSRGLIAQLRKHGFKVEQVLNEN